MIFCGKRSSPSWSKTLTSRVARPRLLRFMRKSWPRRTVPTDSVTSKPCASFTWRPCLASQGLRFCQVLPLVWQPRWIGVSEDGGRALQGVQRQDSPERAGHVLSLQSRAVLLRERPTSQEGGWMQSLLDLAHRKSKKKGKKCVVKLFLDGQWRPLSQIMKPIH